MADHSEIWSELKDLLTAFEEQKEQIYLYYQQLVNSVLSSQIISEREIERIMDSLLDFCDDEKFLALYKALCRHVYNQYPQLVGEHINLFRLQFEEKQEE